jgi:hypothetical protein
MIVTGISAAMAVSASRAALAADDYTLARSMPEYVAALGGNVAQDREDAEVALSLLAASDYDKLLVEARKPGLKLQTAARLKVILDREKPRNEIRTQLRATRMVSRIWNEKTAIESYDKVGRKNPKWDADARKGIQMFVDNSQGQQRVPLENAIAAGCNDPFVLYCEARSLEQWSPADRASIDRFYELAMAGFRKSDYPAMRMAYSAAAFFRYHLNEVFWKDPATAKQGVPPAVAKELDDARGLSYGIWAKFLEDKPPSLFVIGLGGQILDNFDSRTIDRKVPFDVMYAALEKAMPNSSTLYLFKGDFYIKYAWEARGGGYANTVTPQQWKLFFERLAIADEALNKAWDRDPHDERIPTLMLKVELGEHKGPAVERKWFDRAMSVNPDDKSACYQLMTYLLPRWYGSDEAVLAFGRECYNSGNWSGGITSQLITAHNVISSAYTPAEKARYFSQPAVWHDIQLIEEPYQRVIPGNNSQHSEYAYLASEAGHWDIVQKQFDIMGNNAVPAKFGGLEVMQGIRNEAASKAKGATP